MSEQEKDTIQAEETATTEEQTSEDKPEKSAKSAKAGKKSARADKKEQSRLKKEWEDSIVASKKVKREEMRRKLKRAMLIMLVFSLIVTSVVYVMLLFIEENNIRITASNRNRDKSISLSMDNDFWTPYLNADGPDSMWHVSYNPIYGTEKIDTIDEVKTLLEADDVQLGVNNGNQYIRFTFMLKNTGNEAAHIDYEMTLEYDKYMLQDAVRVMWGQSFKNETAEYEKNTDVAVYAALSRNERLAGSEINKNRTAEEGYLEYIAYPDDFTQDVHKGDKNYYVKDYESSVDTATRFEAEANGFVATNAFESDRFVFKRTTNMAKGDIMYCYVCIWLEGSDFECIDNRLGGFCKIGLNFYAS